MKNNVRDKEPDKVNGGLGNDYHAMVEWYANRVYYVHKNCGGHIQNVGAIGSGWCYCDKCGERHWFWGILKRERYYGRRFTDRESLVQMIEEYIGYYNSKRLQRNLGVLTPMEKHEQFYLAA